MAASLELPKGIKPLQPVPTISRYFNDADQPYINAAQVISQNPKDARHLGLTVNIQGVEHWFKAGIEDSDLVVKLLGFNPNFTTQEITTGGYYNDLEVTADLLVFTNENAQAILNGIWGRKEFHILNLSTQYDVRINHNSPSVTGNGVPIKLPTNEGNVGIKGTARILYTTAYGYFVADTWGSTYRPEFKGLTAKKVVTVNPDSEAEAMEMFEIMVFRDGQLTPMSKADLNAAYPTAERPFQVICKEIDLIYIKADNNSNDWYSIPLTLVV